MEKQVVKGKIFFRYSKNGLETSKYDINDLIDLSFSKDEEFLKIYKENYIKDYLTLDIYDLIDGMEFLESVDCGGFIDYDGNISNIIVDGYISNLGLAHKGIMQGNFLVDDVIWKEICEEHDVKVNWANR